MAQLVVFSRVLGSKGNAGFRLIGGTAPPCVL